MIELPSQEVHAFLENWLGVDSVKQMYLSLPTPPPTTLRVNTLISSVEEARDKLHSYLPSQLQDSIRLHPVVPDVIELETLGPIERDHTGLPKMWVSRKCAEAVLRGANIYAPGVLAAEANIRPDHRVAVFADINDDITRGSYRKEVDSKCIYLGNGVARMDREMLFRVAKPAGVAIVLKEARYIAPSLNGILTDRIYLQNLPSTVTTHILDPQPGEYILDMCASPGGKTTHIATLMKNRGRIVAFDRGFEKVKLIKENAERLGITIITAYRNDATKYKKYISETDEDVSDGRDVPLFGRETFDRILVDPPCSALGIRPRLKFEDSLTVKGELEQKAKFQKLFIRAAVMLLKPGGVLVFSTCTVNPLENELNVKYALETFPLQLEEPKIRLGEAGLQSSGLCKSDCDLVQRFNPWSSLDTPGFFCARFVKTESYN